MAKRLFDVTVACFLLLLLSPVVLVTALLVRSKLGAPVLFTQKRAGLRGKPFSIYKFRSMTNERDASGELLPDEVRVTAFGHFLRKSSLDELPQLVNVLKGDLSLVGPRPLYLEYLCVYTPEQARRLEVRPGITGWAQVKGRNAIEWEERFLLDVWYVEHVSLWLDVKILAMTAQKVVAKEGVSAQSHLSMPYFKGSRSEGRSINE